MPRTWNENPVQNNGWCVLGIPHYRDGETEGELEPYISRYNCFGKMVAETDQPRQINFEVIWERTYDNNSN